MKNLKFIYKIKTSINEWLKSVEFENFNFKMSKNGFSNYSLDTLSLACDLKQMIGYKFSNIEKNELEKLLDSYQIMQNGFFAEKNFRIKLEQSKIDRVIEMHSNYITFQALGAYRAINKLPKKKITFYDKFIKAKGIKHYLSFNCPWTKSPWGAGGMVDNLGTILDTNLKLGFEEYKIVLDEIFEWLDVNQSKNNGLWGKSDFQGINGIINGGYHLMRGTYFLQNKSFKYHKKIIDYLIKDLSENDFFSNKKAHGCQDLDHFYLLEKCFKIDSNYRKGEIIAICEKRINDIEKIVYCEDGGFSFEAKNSVKDHNYYTVTPGYKESDLLGTVFYLQTVISILNILGIEHTFNPSKTHA